MPALSIIVPVYNKEKYIDDTIQSILNQSFKDFELILVNDGSTDSSLVKCLQYEDPRVIVIDQENGGVSAARNAGLKSASGQYIGFIDSDDTIQHDMYELLMKNITLHSADISVCRMRVIFPDKTTEPAESPGVIVMGHDEALSACLKGDLDRSANNKIYRASIAKSIQFEGHIYEDILYTCKAFLAAKKTVLENSVKYNYIVRENSVSMSRFNLKYMETIDVSAKMVELVSAKNRACLPDAQTFDVTANISLLNLLLLAQKGQYASQYAQVVENLKKYRSFINTTASVRRKHKYAFRLFSASPKLYTWSMYLYCKLAGSEAVKRT